MKLRILSDLHLYINRKYPLEIPNNYDFTLIAGDIGPEYKKNVEWIRKNIHKGAFISGNHDAYTFDYTPIEDVKEYYHKEFPLESEITYFDYDVGVISKEIDNNLLLIADVLYTDYEMKCFDWDSDLSVEQLIEHNKKRASPKMSGSYMNDFGYVTKNKDFSNGVHHFHNKNYYYLTPNWYLNHFKKSFNEINKIVEENSNKEIILMTHHCLSPQCCSQWMDKGTLTASYISDKEEWIKQHNNIKLIISGHIHNVKEFYIGDTLYVMNPLGYCRENHDIINKWTPDFFVDTKTWKIQKNSYNNMVWEKEHNDEPLSKFLNIF